MSSKFHHFAIRVARSAGHPTAFVLAVLVVVAWALCGPLFDFSDTWQLVINTGTTVITFLMVFLIQNTQDRDSTAMHLKLDELIRATKGAQNVLLDLEECEDHELARMRARYRELARRARADVERKTPDTGTDPDI